LSIVEGDINECEKGYKSFIEDMFRSQANAEAILYNEYRDKYADNLTKFWGIQAGEIEEDAMYNNMEDISAIDTSSLDDLEEETDVNIKANRAQLLYEFYNEPFSSVDQSEDIDYLKSIFLEHYKGTASGQEAKIKLSEEGETLDDILNEDFGLVDAVFGEVDLENADPSQLQTLRNQLEQQGKTFESRGESMVEAKEIDARRVIEANPSEKVEVHRQRFYRPKSGTGEVGTQVEPITVAALGILAIGIGAVGYIQQKSGGSWAIAQEREAVEFSGPSLSSPAEPIASTASMMVNLVAMGQSYNTAGQNAQQSPSSQIDASAGVTAYLYAKYKYKAGVIAGSKALCVEMGKIATQEELAQVADATI
jgi:hypothetical protein